MPTRVLRLHPITTPMLLRSGLVAAAFAATALVAAPRAAGAQGYTVIVHVTNSATTLPRGEVAAIFLKQVTTWPDGTPVVVVDLAERAPARSAFSRAVFNRPATAIAKYWQQQVFSGQGVPPTQRSNDADVVAFVSANPAAVGYVSAATPLPKGVKPVTILRN